MDIIKVKSSMIEAFAYNPRRTNLTVKFNNGSFYRYSGVPAFVVEEMQNSSSVGKYFLSHVKDKYLAEVVNGSKMEKQMAEEAFASPSNGITPARKAQLISAGAWPFPV